MNILVADSLELFFGEHEILRGEGFAVQSGEKIGLIGANGSGKSTLLRLIAQKQQLDGGTFHFAKDVNIGYLPQDILEMPTGRLRQSVLEAAPGKVLLEKRLARVEKDLEAATNPKVQEELAFALADLHERKERFDQDYATTEAEKILVGLGFSERDFDRPLAEFSGGWKMRAALAGLLFRKPDLLLLDEPTNHLDVPTVAWLDNFLKESDRAMILVSHDREFVDRQVNKIMSFEFEGLRVYSGNYTSYLTLREQEEQNLMARAKNIEDKKRQAMRFITRFRAKNTKAKQVQSKLKEIEKLKEIDLPQERRKLRFKFAPTPRTGKDVISISDLDKSYPGVPLFNKLNLNVYKGERIALIGVNGAGKSTLLKMIAGEVEPDAGDIRLGANVELGYYAQHHGETLREDRTVLDEVWSRMPDALLSFVRNVCGAFLFTGDEVDKIIGVLSGGEKARVLLARLLVRPGNLLIMDEPTNHLDIWSSEALAEALETFDGTLLFVSHNSAFVNRLATKIWDLEHGVIHEFPGNLEEYKYHLEQVKARKEAATGVQTPTEPKAVKNEAAPENSREARKEQKRKEAELRQKLHRKLSPITKKIEQLESRIDDLESRRDELEKLLADPKVYENGPESAKLLTEYNEVKEKLEELYARWEYQNEQAEKVREELGGE